MSGSLSNKLGYVTEAKAAEAGFTHNGSYYGVPVWLGGFEDDGLNVAVKWLPFELLFDLASAVESFMRPMLFPDEPAGFQFTVKQPIEAKP